jgi:signal peptidase II
LKQRVAAICSAVIAISANILGQRILMNLGVEGRVLIPGLASLQPGWNRGVSFSLLTQDGVIGRYLLIAFIGLIAAVFALLAWRATSFVRAVGYGLVVGGAVGNLADRFMYGAVFDFLALRLGPVPLFVCNFADIFISIGVALLIADAILPQKASAGDFAA